MALDLNQADWIEHTHLPDGTLWLAIARLAHGYLLRFPEMADFTFDPGQQSVAYTRLGEVPQQTLDHLYFNQVIPLIRAYGGETVLHASAVAFPGPDGSSRAAAFLGESGQGKSTLAAALCRAGGRLLTDDFLVLEAHNGAIIGHPGYPNLRLWPDVVEHLYAGEGKWFSPAAHYTSKQSIPCREGGLALCEQPVPVLRFYFLDNRLEYDAGAAIKFAALNARAAFVALMENGFRLDSQGDRVRQEFEQISQIADQTRCYRLSYPRDFGCLDAVCRAVRSHFESDGEAHCPDELRLPGRCD